MGRQTTFTQEKADRVIAGLSVGTPLTQICAADDMPTDDTVRDWAKIEPVFAADIARAREAGHDAIAHDCLKIGDDVEADAAAVSKAKLRVWTRLELLKKWNPKRYGDKTAIVGGDPASGDKPIAVDVSGLSAATLAEIAGIKVAGE